MHYRMYYTSCHGRCTPRQALCSLNSDNGHLQGEVVLFRRAVIHENVLVNMRAGDDMRAVEAVTRCVTIIVPKLSA